MPKDEDGELDGSELFTALMALSQDDLLSLLAVCAAGCVDAVTARESDSTAHALALALNLDMAQWWTATAESYFNYVNKTRVVEDVRSFAPNTIYGLDKMKKSELTGTAERAAAGTGWLPLMLRRPA